MPSHSVAAPMIRAARELGTPVDRLRFTSPATHVYNPLNYAWRAHEVYLRKYGADRKSVLFLGMNPGPFGMVQSGVPFGEVNAVRDWVRIEVPVRKPRREHPKRPVDGFAGARSEVSGRRLWVLAAERVGSAENFFNHHCVAIYCPLAVIEIPAPGGPEVLRLTRRTTPVPGPGEALIQVAAAGVNRLDVMQRQGRYPAPPGASDIPGVEIAGRVVSVGVDVTSLRVGDRVCALLAGGGYAEYCVAPAAQCLPTPGRLDFIQS